MAQVTLDVGLTARLSKHWTGQSGLALGKPAEQGQIRAFERKYGVTCPEDMCAYLRFANGFEPQGDQDAEGFSFWPLERIVPCAEYEQGRFGNEDGLFLFADYLGSSWIYGIRLAGVPLHRVDMVGTAHGVPRTVAGSFREFLELYLVDDRRLYPE